jgi:hypothetical protein
MSVTFSGAFTFSGGGFTATLAPPSSATAGWFGGGYTGVAPGYKSIVDRITYATDTSTATARGPLSSARYNLAATGNFTDGWFGGGDRSSASSPTTASIVDRITYATDTATASVRGPLSIIIYSVAATGNTTDGWFGGGTSPSAPGIVSTVQRITFATDTATASVRGSLSLARRALAATGNTTDGWFGGGNTTGSVPGLQSTVDRITYATDTATASTRGPLSLTRSSLAATTDGTNYGWFGGGSNPINMSTIDRITYATDTDIASVRGPLSVAVQFLSASGSTTDGWFSGGFVSGGVSTVQRITYATDTATASVRGPLSSARYGLAGAAGLQ